MKMLMLNSKNLTHFVSTFLCIWLCACQASDRKADNRVDFQSRGEISGEVAIGMVLELQRLYVMCSKLEPAKSDLIASQYREAKLTEFEKLLPIDQNPYVAVISEESTFNAAYVNVDSETRSDALKECNTDYPRELDRLKKNEEAVRKAVILQLNLVSRTK